MKREKLYGGLSNEEIEELMAYADLINEKDKTMRTKQENTKKTMGIIAKIKKIFKLKTK